MENMENYKIIEINDEPIISLEEQTAIVDWTKKNCNKFKKTGFNRSMIGLHLVPDFPEFVKEIKQRIELKENLKEYRQEPTIRDAIGIMVNGGKLPEHLDSNQQNNSLIHARYNIYVQIPLKGGLPVYNNQIINIKERNYVCCRSGIDLHSCLQVEGEKERIVLSFGYLVPIEKIHEIHIIYEI
jgi:hypothetical protein